MARFDRPIDTSGRGEENGPALASFAATKLIWSDSLSALFAEFAEAHFLCSSPSQSHSPMNSSSGRLERPDSPSRIPDMARCCF
jgi:hypothetical protein